MQLCVYDTKCDIVFMILQVIKNEYINGVNSAMLPPSLMVLIPLLYCDMFILNSTTKRVTRVDEIDQSDEGYMRGDQGDLKRTVNILEDQHFYKIYFYNKMCKNPNICSWKAIKLS